jgi:hypothetical protein
MTAPLAMKLHAVMAPSILALVTFLVIASWQHNGIAARLLPSRQQVALSSNYKTVQSLAHDRNDSSSSLPSSLDVFLDAMDVMQEKYFEVSTGTWPDSIDWTAAVLGTHVSATLSTLVMSIDPATCTETLAWDNLINRYFSYTSIFYFGENALSLRQQAYDDMLWVVLGWLENIKFIDLYSSIRSNHANNDPLQQQPWYGTHFKSAAAHRARIFYDLASRGWDTSLCNGGMLWNRFLSPYKNSITNELFISASISMYLYFPGDDNDSPFLASTKTPLKNSRSRKSNEKKTSSKPRPHDPMHLQNAIDAYAWLKSSNMTSPYHSGLYADGYHISGWHRTPTGRIDPGTGKCDDLNTMVYTYNQGVVLTGLRGLWLATGEIDYLEDGHELIEAVLESTGWNNPDSLTWSGLGRGGVLEEYCDSRGDCNQDGQTFKGIFFNHLAEFCRDLSEVEEDFFSSAPIPEGLDRQVWKFHLFRCDGYHDWVEHNARAAAVTRDEEGKFGMWWGRAYPDDGSTEDPGYQMPLLPLGAVDHASVVGQVTLKAAAPSESRDVNARGRGRTVETQSGGVAVLRALWQWEGVGGE